MKESSESGSVPQINKMAESLRVDAEVFVPKRQEKNLRPVRTFAPRREVLATLDAVPFTPSQGICTPTPTHMVMMQQPMVYHGYEYSPRWEPMANVASPGSNGSSFGAGVHSPGSGVAEHSPGTSQPGTPYGQPLLYSSFYFPMPFSPRVLQQAAQQGLRGSPKSAHTDPHTPARTPRSKPASENGVGGYFAPVAFSSPMAGGASSPGQLVFSQFFASDSLDLGAGGECPDSPPEGGDMAHSMGAGGSGYSDDADPAIELTPAARQIAAAMCAAQNLQGPPPNQLVELASLLQAYGLVNSQVSPPSSSSVSPDKQQVRRTKSQPRTNPDGTLRLNARQRRTLRRAQERALKALVELQIQTMGIDGEQAAANLATMVGMQPGVFGSPPQRGVAPMPPATAQTPVHLQSMPPMQALYPMPMMTPLPPMMASSWSGMPTPVISQPLHTFPLDHAMSMPVMMPLGRVLPDPPLPQHPMAYHAHGAPPHMLQHPSGHMAAGGGPGPRPSPFFGGGPSHPSMHTGGGGGYLGPGAAPVHRAATAPHPYGMAGEAAAGGSGSRGPRLSRFAPPAGRAAPQEMS